MTTAALPPGTARQCEITTPDGRVKEVFVVREGARVYAYENRCPHTGASLNWAPDQFLDPSGGLIVCANHGALFRIGDGVCLAGPCVGEALTAVPVVVRGDEITLHLE